MQEVLSVRLTSVEYSFTILVVVVRETTDISSSVAREGIVAL